MFFSSRYTSGDVRVWDTRTWDYVAPFLESESEEEEPGMQPYVSFVRINSSLAVAAYEDGEYPSTPALRLPVQEKASSTAAAAAAPMFSLHTRSRAPCLLCIGIYTFTHTRLFWEHKHMYVHALPSASI